MRNISDTLVYFRNSIADSDRMMPDEHRLKEGEIIEMWRWTTGYVPQEIVNKLWLSKVNKSDVDPHGRRAFLICPWVGILKPQHGLEKKALPSKIAPVWLPFWMDANGALTPDTTKQPWIPRNLLEPIYPARLVLGTLKDVDGFLASNPWVDPEHLSEENADEYRLRLIKAWWDYAKLLFKHVTNTDINDFNIPEYYKDKNCLIVSAPKPSIWANGLISLYDYIQRDNAINNPIKAILSEKTSNELLSKIDYWFAQENHLVHLPTHPSLSMSQRKIMHHFLGVSPSVMALNGPPGTGKTYTLANLFIQKWIRAILLNEDAPLYLLTSLSNQALHNLNKQIKDATSGVRWIKELNSLSTLCLPPSRQEKLNDDVPYITINEDGTAWDLLKEDFVQRAMASFLQESKDEFKETLSIDQTVEKIRNIIIDRSRQLQTGSRFNRQLQTVMMQKNDIVEMSGEDTFYEAYVEKIEVMQARRELAWKRMNYILHQWEDHKSRTPLWLKLLGGLPGGRQRLLLRNKSFFSRLGFTPKNVDLTNDDEISYQLQSMGQDIRNLLKEHSTKMTVIKSVQKAEETLDKMKNEMERSHIWAIADLTDQGYATEKWDSDRDLNERMDLFKWVVRYWEGRFLQKSQEAFLNKKNIHKKSKKHQIDRFRRLACLTPCFASTIHSAPRFFTSWQIEEQPLYELFDLIIIDEAGQISPELGIGLFSLGKQVVLAGDQEQIEPVWGVPEKTDIGNLMEYGLIGNPMDIDEFTDTGLSASSGSLIKRINYIQTNHLWLEEQHRSHPELVAYSNRLCYNDRLIADRTIKAGAFAPFGYAHVNGNIEYHWGSKGNRIEAQTIAEWVASHYKEWLKHYKVENLGDIFGVITPFVRQVQILKQEFAKLNIPEISIGTVHSFQGSERNLILFSPVENLIEKHVPFFDQDKHFLNVAVSRARDAFWIIGNLNKWDSRGLSPSGQLSYHLFRGYDRRLDGIVLSENTVHGLPTDGFMGKDLKQRHQEMISIINESFHQLNIATPLIDTQFIKENGIFDALLRAKNRGTDIIIYVNKTLTQYKTSTEIAELHAMCRDHGFKWIWKDYLFDSRIWNQNKMLESSTPVLSDRWDNGTYRVYTGSVNIWCNSQINNW